MLLYIGPGMSAATLVIVAIVLAIILLSLFVVVWRPIKRRFKRSKNKQGDQ